ncbi:MAG: tetratricopeptide repeat protein [Kofleriaceae bacterium]|nr:tetratricopeptide repeat protein [Kofleriaceae bacterium]
MSSRFVLAFVIALTHALAFAEPSSSSDRQAACAAKDADACFALGTDATRADDRATASNHFAAACLAGHGLACIYTADAEPNASKQLRWRNKAGPAFERRCAKDDAEHCYYLGISYERGNGARRSPAKSFAAYRKSCNLGFTLGCTNLAGSYLDGNGTTKDPVKAAELYTTQCRRSDDHACYMLGRIHSDELGAPAKPSRTKRLSAEVHVNVLDNKDGSSATKVPAYGRVLAALGKAASAEPLRKGCDGRQGLDCYLLGLMSELGIGGVAADDPKAAELHRRACDAGNGWGCFRLADMYMSGRGVAKSIGDGAHYYNEVCAKRVGGEGSFIPECNAVLERMGL